MISYNTWQGDASTPLYYIILGISACGCFHSTFSHFDGDEHISSLVLLKMGGEALFTEFKNSCCHATNLYIQQERLVFSFFIIYPIIQLQLCSGQAATLTKGIVCKGLLSSFEEEEKKTQNIKSLVLHRG